MFITKYNKVIISSLMIILSFLIMAQVALAAYDSNRPAETTGLTDTATQGYGKLPTDTNLSVIIGKIVGTILAFLGVVFFGIILYAGIGWITSMGNEVKITEAKNMIIAAVLGLIVVLGAYAITNVVAQIFTDSTGMPR